MQVSVETTSGLERRLTVGVPSEQVESAINERLQRTARTIRLDGFRPGKVPFKVVKQRFGEGVRQEVVGELIGNTFYEAVAREALKPAGRPSIEPTSNESGKDLEYVATFEVYPEISLADPAQVSIARPAAEVTEADLDNMIDVLRKQQATWTEVEREAQEGDQVNLDYTGAKDGEAFEGSDLVIGSDQMIPSFEDALVGMKAGDEKVAPLTFPEDYHDKELKGAEVEVSLKVNAVKEQTLPELNEDFFRLFGEKATDEAAFRQEVRNNMERELKNAIQYKVKSRILRQYCKLHEVEVPGALLKQEIDVVKQQMFSQMGGGVNVASNQLQLPDELFSEQATKRVINGLVISEYVSANGVKVDDELVKAKIEEIASTYEKPEEVIQYYYGNEQLLNNLQASVLEEQVVAMLEARAQVTEESVSYEEAVKPDVPADEEDAAEESSDKA